MRARSTHIGTIPKDSLERFKALHWGVHSCTRESVWLRRYHSAVIFANFLVFATVPINDIFLFPSKVRILIMKTYIFILIIGDVLCRRYEDEQYSCYENEHLSNMGIFGDPYCCDTNLTVASFFEQRWTKIEIRKFWSHVTINFGENLTFLFIEQCNFYMLKRFSLQRLLNQTFQSRRQKF